MLYLLCRALTPAMNLLDAIQQWDQVRHQLAEPPRKRPLQRVKAHNILS